MKGFWLSLKAIDFPFCFPYLILFFKLFLFFSPDVLLFRFSCSFRNSFIFLALKSLWKVRYIIPLSFVIFSSGCTKNHSPNQIEIDEVEGDKTAAILPVCQRTEQVKQAILEILGKTECSEVTQEELSSFLILKMNNKGLNELKSGDFSGLNSLRELDISRNKLARLPEGIFLGLSALKTLDLSVNKLSHLPAGVFSGLNSLQILNLSINDLKSLSIGLFSDLNFLQELFLSRNELKNLPPKLFSNLSSLKTLYLVKNPLTSSDKTRIRSQLTPYKTNIRF